MASTNPLQVFADAFTSMAKAVISFTSKPNVKPHGLVDPISMGEHCAGGRSPYLLVPSSAFAVGTDYLSAAILAKECVVDPYVKTVFVNDTLKKSFGNLKGRRPAAVLACSHSRKHRPSKRTKLPVEVQQAATLTPATETALPAPLPAGLRVASDLAPIHVALFCHDSPHFAALCAGRFTHQTASAACRAGRVAIRSASGTGADFTGGWLHHSVMFDDEITTRQLQEALKSSAADNAVTGASLKKILLGRYRKSHTAPAPDPTSCAMSAEHVATLMVKPHNKVAYDAARCDLTELLFPTTAWAPHIGVETIAAQLPGIMAATKFGTIAQVSFAVVGIANPAIISFCDIASTITTDAGAVNGAIYHIHRVSSMVAAMPDVSSVRVHVDLYQVLQSHLLCHLNKRRLFLIQLLPDGRFVEPVIEIVSDKAVQAKVASRCQHLQSMAKVLLPDRFRTLVADYIQPTKSSAVGGAKARSTKKRTKLVGCSCTYGTISYQGFGKRKFAGNDCSFSDFIGDGANRSGVDMRGLLTAAGDPGGDRRQQQTGFYFMPSGKYDHRNHLKPEEELHLRNWRPAELDRVFKDDIGPKSTNLSNNQLRVKYDFKTIAQAKSLRALVMKRQHAVQAAAAATALQKPGGGGSSSVARAVSKLNPIVAALTQLRADPKNLVILFNTATLSDGESITLVEMLYLGEAYDVTSAYTQGLLEKGDQWSFAGALVEGSGSGPDFDPTIFVRKDPSLWNAHTLTIQAIIIATPGEVCRSIHCMEVSDFDVAFNINANGYKYITMSRCDGNNNDLTSYHGFIKLENVPVLDLFFDFANFIIFGTAVNGILSCLTDGCVVEISVVESKRNKFGRMLIAAVILCCARKRCAWHSVSKPFVVKYGMDKLRDGGVGCTVFDWLWVIVKQTETPDEVEAQFQALRKYLSQPSPKPSDRRATDSGAAHAFFKPRMQVAAGGAGAMKTRKGKSEAKKVDGDAANDDDEPDFVVEQFVYIVGDDIVRVKLAGIGHTDDLNMHVGSLEHCLDGSVFQELMGEMKRSNRTIDNTDLPEPQLNSGVAVPGQDGCFQVDRLVRSYGTGAKRLWRVRWAQCEPDSDTYEHESQLKSSADGQFQAMLDVFERRTEGQVAQDVALPAPPILDASDGSTVSGITFAQRQKLLAVVSNVEYLQREVCAGWLTHVRDFGKHASLSERRIAALKKSGSVGKRVALAQSIAATLSVAERQTSEYLASAERHASTVELPQGGGGPASSTAAGSTQTSGMLLTKHAQALLDGQFELSKQLTATHIGGGETRIVRTNPPSADHGSPWPRFVRSRVVYQVSVDSAVHLVCSCPFWRKHGVPCKHVLACTGTLPPASPLYINGRWFAAAHAGRLNRLFWAELKQCKAPPLGPVTWGQNTLAENGLYIGGGCQRGSRCNGPALNQRSKTGA